MNQQSIPRLEFCAAVLAVRLSLIVLREHHFDLEGVYFWTDSTTVLSYVRNTSKRRPAFETNRIATILKHTNVNQWRWVDTHQNSADPYSRGVSPKQVHKAQKWLKASEFLLKDETLWPSFGKNAAYPSEPFSLLNFKDAVECQCSQVLSNRNFFTTEFYSVPEVLVRLTTKFSALRRAVKSTVWLLRAIGFLQDRVKAKTALLPIDNHIGPQEYDNALITLICLVQQQEFPGFAKL